MIPVIDIFLTVITICLVTLVAVIVPTQIQIKQSARRIDALIDSLNQELPPLLRSLAHTSREIQTLTETIKNKADRTDKVIERAKEAADNLFITTSIVKNSIAPIYTQISGFSVGVRAFLHYLTNPDKHS
ncbi:MAG: hypothetical protein A2521_01935 [Deltaproteobacteria bacterium RIFOXYD12_FULL_57_12]|nr:MAG: hypothetical protein A2521_01935 [Deltaproteobacteria bacterium RIFOXYD12_FULL_57_12]